ncbi:LPXTG cell wall anchor domain-containing protein [Jiangella asiatica]|nr:LPXTG cell wall anchor domain-containing protein [Jiangella asiatica]
MSSLLVLLGGATMAQAATPVYEIHGDWVNVSPPVSRGTPVVAEWRVNVNDADEPPSNDPVENATATFTVDKAFFDDIPDLCLTEGVDPPSSISEDGMTLTCNFGPVKMGTAIVVQTPVVANGSTGEEIVLDGTSPSGENVELPPVLIENPFVMDMQWTGTTDYERWDDPYDPHYVDVDLQWSLRLGKGSDPGPTDPITFRLNVAAKDGSNVPQAVQVGFHPPNAGVEDNWNKEGCTSYDFAQADGHPYSSNPPAARHTNFVGGCTLTQVGPTAFDLTLSGINYDLTNVPEVDSLGHPLPPNWDYVASGSVWFRVTTQAAGTISLSMAPETYEAPTGQSYDDLPGNNTSNKVYTLPGGFRAGYWRPYTGSGGTPNDNTYRVPAGTTVNQWVNTVFDSDQVDPDTQYGNCLVFDPTYMTAVEPPADAPYAQIRGLIRAGNPGYPDQSGQPLNNPPPIWYYTGGVGDPNAFDCFTGGGWSTTPPADIGTVTAVRILYPHSLPRDEGVDGIQLNWYTRVNDDAPVGEDAWMYGSALRNGNTLGPGEPWDSQQWAPAPEGAEHAYTNGRRDFLQIVLAEPYIEKSAAEPTVTPGVPADFTLTYSATGAGLVPPTVDGYQIVDTLPVGMTYKPGSADPEPTVTMNGQNQQILTWTLDDVATNVEHELTYQATADSSIPPGTPLTNTAQSSLAGADSAPVEETVTTTTNGYTTILKTSDVEYIPNRNGDGVGTGSWTVTIESHDPITQAFTDTIDILPYNGDGRGTSYSGTYTLDEVVTPDGGTVYYTDADPTTLTDDPLDEPNGAPGAPSDLWTTERPENPTAIRVIGGELVSGESFSFQVVISTDGAEPRDVYVNQAQARAEHTELVMRTSASLVVTDYITEKSSDPEDGSTVKPGDTITYTVTVTQVGDVPSGAVFTDDVSDVLDDAVYNDDIAADIGTATFEDGVITWEGEIPVGEIATITYSVTVKDATELDEGDSNTFLHNQVESPGCVDEESCDTEHPVGYYTVSKTADPAPGETVGINDVVTYHVQVIQKGEGAVEGAFLDDDLTAVLDDATYNDDATATSGEVSYEEPTLSWAGDLAVGEVVDLTYSVTVTGEGDYQLANVVTSICPEDDPDCLEGICVPAPDENPDCQTMHPIGDYEVEKTSDPVDGSQVEVGDVVEYTVTVTHVGAADVAATFDDDLSAVLDDATYNDDAQASAGEVSYAEPTLTWAGDLSEGDVVTVTYSVAVTADGDRHLKNVVTTPGDCVPAEGQDEACTTEHINGAYTFSKTSDPEPGSEVEEGEVVTYTVTVEQVGTAPVEDAIVVDDLSQVAEVADWNDDATATSGQVSMDNEELTWTGDLEVGQVVTITYSVTVGDEADATMRNVVTSPDDRGECVPAADGNPDCETEHHTPGAGPDLPDTGTNLTTWFLISGLILLIGGLALAASVRRRQVATDGRSIGPDDLI